MELPGTWKVKALSLHQLTLHGDQPAMPLDTSIGHLYVKFPYAFLFFGWRCPIICWCLLCLGVGAAVGSQLTWPLLVPLFILALCAGSLGLALRRRCVSWKGSNNQRVDGNLEEYNELGSKLKIRCKGLLGPMHTSKPLCNWPYDLIMFYLGDICGIVVHT